MIKALQHARTTKMTAIKRKKNSNVESDNDELDVYDEEMPLAVKLHYFWGKNMIFKIWNP